MSVMRPELGMSKEQQVDSAWNVLYPKISAEKLAEQVEAAYAELLEDTAVQVAYEICQYEFARLDWQTTPQADDTDEDGDWLQLVWDLAYA